MIQNGLKHIYAQNSREKVCRSSWRPFTQIWSKFTAPENFLMALFCYYFPRVCLWLFHSVDNMGMTCNICSEFSETLIDCGPYLIPHIPSKFCLVIFSIALFYKVWNRLYGMVAHWFRKFIYFRESVYPLILYFVNVIIFYRFGQSPLPFLCKFKKFMEIGSRKLNMHGNTKHQDIDVMQKYTYKNL